MEIRVGVERRWEVRFEFSVVYFFVNMVSFREFVVWSFILDLRVFLGVFFGFYDFFVWSVRDLLFFVFIYRA